MGVERLYLYTGPACGLYERLGWRPIADGWYEGRPVVVMAVEMASGRSRRPPLPLGSFNRLHNPATS